MIIYVIVEEEQDGSIYINDECFTDKYKASEVLEELRETYQNSVFGIKKAELKGV